METVHDGSPETFRKRRPVSLGLAQLTRKWEEASFGGVVDTHCYIGFWGRTEQYRFSGQSARAHRRLSSHLSAHAVAQAEGDLRGPQVGDNASPV